MKFSFNGFIKKCEEIGEYDENGGPMLRRRDGLKAAAVPVATAVVETLGLSTEAEARENNMCTIVKDDEVRELYKKRAGSCFVDDCGEKISSTYSKAAQCKENYYVFNFMACPQNSCQPDLNHYYYTVINKKSRQSATILCDFTCGKKNKYLLTHMGNIEVRCPTTGRVIICEKYEYCDCNGVHYTVYKRNRSCKDPSFIRFNCNPNGLF